MWHSMTVSIIDRTGRTKRRLTGRSKYKIGGAIVKNLNAQKNTANVSMQAFSATIYANANNVRISLMDKLMPKIYKISLTHLSEIRTPNKIMQMGAVRMALAFRTAARNRLIVIITIIALILVIKINSLIRNCKNYWHPSPSNIKPVC